MGRAKRALGGGKLKAQDWPSTLRRGAGHARWPLGGRSSADEGPNLVEKCSANAERSHGDQR